MVCTSTCTCLIMIMTRILNIQVNNRILKTGVPLKSWRFTVLNLSGFAENWVKYSKHGELYQNQHISHNMTKPTKWLCPQQRLRSAQASTQSDQSSLSTWRKLGSLATHWAHIEDSDQTGQMSRLIWVFAGRTLILLVLSCHSSHDHDMQLKF